jgi:hypothetical protein
LIHASSLVLFAGEILDFEASHASVQLQTSKVPDIHTFPNLTPFQVHVVFKNSNKIDKITFLKSALV